MDDSSRAYRAERYRELAVALDGLAPQLKNAEARKEIEGLALVYARLAEHAERSPDAGPVYSGVAGH